MIPVLEARQRLYFSDSVPGDATEIPSFLRGSSKRLAVVQGQAPRPTAPGGDGDLGGSKAHAGITLHPQN